MEKSKKLTLRALISISLFFLIIILFITAVGIQIFDELIDPEIIISAYKNPETQPFLLEILHVIKAIHVISGFIFVILSAVHIIKNWKVLKGYLKK
jgi:hypothetical protein